tara:strand:+ start:68 stop:1222 length:1155 start_codon:yes stop_codon:yes gene_type:complete
MKNVELTLKQISERHRPLDSDSLSALIQVYLTQRQRSWRQKHSETNSRDNKPKITLLVEVLGDIQSADLSPSHLVKFRDTLHKLPSNRTKGIYAGKSIDELLHLDVDESKRWSPTTVKNYAQKVSSFLKWLARNNYSVAGLEQPLAGIKRPEKAAHEERPIFTPDELNRLFESKEYLHGTHKKPSHYWVPLLALYTGARQTELCQLYVEDVRRDASTQVWVIDINEKHDDQKLKKPHHARLVPIHKKLIQLGFLEYVSSLASDRVFPDLKFQRDGYGQSLSKWFCRTYLNDNHCKIRKSSRSEDAVFHSFRHTVATQLSNTHDIQPHHISHLVGQMPPGNSETTKRYIKPSELLDRQRSVNKLDYPSIDLGKIRNWKHGYTPFR